MPLLSRTVNVGTPAKSLASPLFSQKSSCWKTGLIATAVALTQALTPALMAQDSQSTEKEAPKQKWDITNPPLSTALETIEFSVTEGTWMSLDVSPDGKNLVFDLLGDLYTLPLSGGKAVPITSGISWDMQPRFSPDGRKIAFTSDRDGGDNIWIINADGSAEKQITKENFRLVNNPTWSPDGQYIAARKHFTTTRSLGTGEIWLYHIEGGSGSAIVERPNPIYQKELGEPLFAPDGQSIYYSQNVTPGNSFIYAQDSNTELFRIRRVDLQTGLISDVAGGPGGAVRPTPSPDGKHIAFVRRVRAKSRLFLKNLETGTEKMLVDDLDQDNQETWAVQGLYPNMDWLPDNSGIVYWAKGKIWRVTLEGQKTVIPFSITDKRRVAPAVRRKIEVAPEILTTKMARFASRSPNGRHIIFESLGKLYLKTAEDAPIRLNSEDGFQFYPIWSKDSKSVYYIRWDDQDLASIYEQAIRGGSAKKLSPFKGHLRHLALSPDGKTLLFDKVRGGGLFHPDYSENTGVYALSLDSGKVFLVTQKGTNPHMLNNGRIAVYRNGEKQSLVTMTIDGHDERTVATSDFALEMKLSPGGRHLLFEENYHLYVTPLPLTGKALHVGPKAAQFPKIKLTDIGSAYPHWAKEGDSISWTIGSLFKEIDLTETAKKDFTPPKKGVSLAMSIRAAQPNASYALTNARIITMNDTNEVIENGTILVNNNRIKAVGASLDIPKDSQIYDMTGKTIIPGLIDIHAHGPYGSGDVIPQQNWSTDAHLAFGVTTLHNPSSQSTLVFPAAEYQRSGVTLAPRIFSTGEIVYGAKHPFWAEIETFEDALSHVKRLKAQGAVAVKNYNQPQRRQRQQVVEAARQEGLFVVAEGGALYHMDMNLIVDGNTGVEHTLPNQMIYDDVLQFWPQTNVGMTPTLVVAYGGLTTETYFYQESDVWKHPILSRYVPPKQLQSISVRRTKAPEEDYADRANAAFAKQLMERGVMINIGAHGQREGLAAHWEMWGMVRGGMSSLQALMTATKNPARYFGMEADLGSIEADKLADMVILRENPLENIRNSDKIDMIILNGRAYDPLTLNEVLTGNRQHVSPYWHGQAESEIR